MSTANKKKRKAAATAAGSASSDATAPPSSLAAKVIVEPQPEKKNKPSVLEHQLGYGKFVSDLMGVFNVPNESNHERDRKKDRIAKLVTAFDFTPEISIEIGQESLLSLFWSAAAEQESEMFFYFLDKIFNHIDNQVVLKRLISHETKNFDILVPFVTSTFRSDLPLFRKTLTLLGGSLSTTHRNHVGLLLDNYTLFNPDLLSMLIEFGYNINLSTSGITPLMQVVSRFWQVSNGSRLLEMLLSRILFSDLNFNCETKNGITPKQLLDNSYQEYLLNRRNVYDDGNKKLLYNQFQVLLTNAEWVWNTHQKEMSILLTIELSMLPTTICAVIHEFLFAKLVVV